MKIPDAATFDTINDISRSKDIDDLINASEQKLSALFGIRSICIVKSPFDRNTRSTVWKYDKSPIETWSNLADCRPQETLTWRAMQNRTAVLIPWSRRIGRRSVSDKRWFEFCEQVEGLGYTNNASITLWSPDPAQQRIVSFMTILNPADHINLIRTQTAQLLGLASAIAIRADAHAVGTFTSQNIRLSSREKDCLSWLAAGLRHKEIAHRLNITEWTVNFHIGNVRKKLGAATTEQAMVQATLLGLINL